MLSKSFFLCFHFFLLLSPFSPYFTYKLVAHPKVARHLYVGKSLGNLWVTLPKIPIAFFGSLGE